MTYQIRDMKTSDIDAVFNIGVKETKNEVVKGSSYWERSQIEDWVKAASETGDVLMVAEKEGVIGGYVTSILHKPTGKAVIENIDIASGEEDSLESALIKECEQKLVKNGAKFITVLTKEPKEGSILRDNGYSEGFQFTWYMKAAEK